MQLIYPKLYTFSRRISTHFMGKLCVFLAVLLIIIIVVMKVTNTHSLLDTLTISDRLPSSSRNLSNKAIPVEESKRQTVFDSLAALNWSYELVSYTTTDKDILIENNFYKGSKILVPNIIHYVWLGTDLKFKFIHYLSFLSVHKFLKPEAILVYGEKGPEGEWWERVRREVANVYHVIKETPPASLNGQKFRFKAHASDLLRTEAVYKLGGIYFDADVLVLKSFVPIRIYSTTLGRERNDGLCNGIIIAEPQAPFVRLLLDQYHKYDFASEAWAEKSVRQPHFMAMKHPNIIHVEEKSLHRPNWAELPSIYDKVYDWSSNYALHLWIRKMYEKGAKVADSVEDIDCLNTTLGEISRHIYYGSKVMLCHQKGVNGTSKAS